MAVPKPIAVNAQNPLYSALAGGGSEATRLVADANSRMDPLAAHRFARRHRQVAEEEARAALDQAADALAQGQVLELLARELLDRAVRLGQLDPIVADPGCRRGQFHRALLSRSRLRRASARGRRSCATGSRPAPRSPRC